jgi:hypothetical protein
MRGGDEWRMRITSCLSKKLTREEHERNTAKTVAEPEWNPAKLVAEKRA